MIKKENQIEELIHLLSLYHVLSCKQLYKLYPELPEATIHTLIKKLEKTGRVHYVEEEELLISGTDSSSNSSFNTTMLLSAFWVLLDFFTQISYHTTGEFPVILTFFMKEKRYEVIYIEEGKEILINGILTLAKEEVERLVIIKEIQQIKKIDFPRIKAFCMVSEDGDIQYFKKQGVN